MRIHRLLLLAVSVVSLSRPAAAADAPPASAAPGLAPEARTRLHEALAGAESFKVRLQAALVLGRRGDAALDLEALTAALRHDDHYTVRGAAALALGHLGSPEAVEPLLDALDDPEAFVRKGAREAVGRLAGPDALPYLQLARAREEPAVRRLAAETAAKIDGPAARAVVVGFLGDPDPQVEAVVVAALHGWPRDAAVDALVAALGDPSYRVREGAARLAAAFPDPRLVHPLAARLAAPLEEPHVQVAASRSLEALRDLLETEDLVKRVLGLVDRDARVEAITLLGIQGGPRAVEVLGRALEDPDVRIRGYAVMALGRAGDPAVAPRIEALRRDPANARIDGVIRAALRDLRGMTPRR